MATLISIDLAHEAELRLGRLTIRPGVRQVVDEAGAAEILEPRVMQVLVALAREPGRILSRDDLIELCWDGRIVGEDAINRVISRLRRVAEGIGAGVFRIETITKVGYRLVQLEADAPDTGADPTPLPPHMPERPAPPAVSRRGLIAGGVALAGAALGGGLWWRGRVTDAPPPPSDPVAVLIEEGRDAMRQAEPQSIAQAVGLLRRAVELAPRSAEAWGLLATAYAGQMFGRPSGGVEESRMRAEAAIARASALDPNNPDVAVARGMMLPKRGAWAEADRIYGAALARHPKSIDLLFAYGMRLSMVGRMRESAVLSDRAAALLAKPTPIHSFYHALALWGAGRLDEADRAIAQAMELFPLHYAVWFTRYFLYLYSGRADRALAMGADVENRPRGIPTWNFEMVQAVAKAMMSRAPADVDAAMAINMEAARRGAGFAENTIQFASALGRLDQAFAVADAYLFGRGFEVSERRFSEIQGVYTRFSDRRTTALFAPSTAAMRGDPRFERLVEEIGLTRYWREAGIVPDYRAG